jgi:PAS domain S-box-containing protein
LIPKDIVTPPPANPCPTWPLEQKNGQQARLLDLAPCAIFLRTLDDVIFYWNQGAERLYGWMAGEAIGRKTTDLFCEDPAAAQSDRQRILEFTEWTSQVKQITKSGQELTVDSRCMLLSEPDHPPIILTINTDITERKKLEGQFMRSQRLESIGRLASGIAHDLNNILAPMLMTPSLLREELKSESSRALLDTIETTALRGSEIVKQLLAFGRGLDLQPGPVQLRLLLQDMVQMMRATFPKNIVIRSETVPDPWLVTGDATQLHQVLMNLCLNARDALPHGGHLNVTLENTFLDESIISMMPGCQAGPYVVLTVTDTGAGIPPEHLDRIFDPFFTTKPRGQGTGLGLSTVLGIVHSHLGFILVKSKLGQGAQFLVYLPANLSHQIAPASQLEKPPQGSGELVLVVDDEENIRIMLRRALDHHGYRCLLASDGPEALTLYSENHGLIQAVVTDLAMPFMDGPDLIAALRQLNPHLKILAISGQLLVAEDETMPPFQTGAFLAKPFTADAFLKTLHELLCGTSATVAAPASLASAPHPLAAH